MPDALASTAPVKIAVTRDGDAWVAQRQASVDRFQKDAAIKIFVGQITAAGVGITLTAAAHVIFAEADWTPGAMQQAADRAHRIGQKSSVLVQHLVLDGSIDAKMAQTIVAKQTVIDAALDGPTAEPAQPEALPAVEFVDALPAKPVPVERPATHNVKREQIRAEGEKLTAEQIAAVHAALRMLAGLDADRAMVRNDMGFNRYDGRIGHELAAHAELTRPQAALGRRLLLKYRRQLGDELTATIRGAEAGNA